MVWAGFDGGTDGLLLAQAARTAAHSTGIKRWNFIWLSQVGFKRQLLVNDSRVKLRAVNFARRRETGSCA
jgi:hypothetical protein